MSTQRRVFPESFKREAVDRVASSGLSAGAVARATLEPELWPPHRQLETLRRLLTPLLTPTLGAPHA